MKIMSLNTWGGRAGKEKLIDFFVQHKDDIDVFCLQEIWAAPYEHCENTLAGGLPIKHENIMVNGLQDISEILTDFTIYFHPHHGENYGLMMAVKKIYDVVESGDVFVYKERGYIPEGDLGNHARNIEYVTIHTDKGLMTIINFHGLWNGKGKVDSEDRLIQSDNILKFTEDINNPFIICGDFNLLPETESIKKFEQAGLKNLIKEYAVTSTRTSFYTRPEKFADYAFVSPGVLVSDFKVLNDEVSDHAPLLIDFDIGK